MSDRGSLRRGAPIAPRVLFVTPSDAPFKPWPAAVGNFPNRCLLFNSRVSRVSRKVFNEWHTCGGQPPGSALAARCSPWAAGGGIGRHSCRLSAYARCVCRARAALPARLEAPWSMPA